MFDSRTLSELQKKLLSIFLLGLIFGVFAFGANQLVTIWSDLNSRSIPFRVTVSGEGKIEARPDIATFTATVLTNAKTAQEAETQNSKKANAIVSYLKKNGVADEDIKTGQFSIYPQYQYYDVRPCTLGFECPPPKAPEIISYQVRNSIEAKARKLERVGELLKGVTANGANEIFGPNFVIENQENFKAEARKKAIADARSKIQFMAKDLDVKIGRVVDFNESQFGYPIYARALEAGIGGGGDKNAPPPIEPGQNEIRVNVTITYELK